EEIAGRLTQRGETGEPQGVPSTMVPTNAAHGALRSEYLVPGTQYPVPGPQQRTHGIASDSDASNSAASDPGATSDLLPWLQRECGVSESAAAQAVAYVAAQVAAIDLVPTQRRIVFERFFDEGGGMQLVIHAPLGARINRAWGLALRKRFCRSFNF